MPPVLVAARGKAGVLVLARREQPRRRRAQRAGTAFGNRAAQEHPRSLAPPLGQHGIAQDFHMARDARLALPQHLRQFAHRQLHVGQQPHDPQPGRVRQRAQGGFKLHRKGI